MNFDLSGDQRAIVDEVQKTCRAFDENYWRKHDAEALFPHAFHKAMADTGWLGIAMPEAQGGAELGITEAALMLQAVSASGAGFSGASAIHMNIFGLNPVVVFGSGLIASCQRELIVSTSP
jgi:acyl-CoA dehydrogenase